MPQPPPHKRARRHARASAQHTHTPLALARQYTRASAQNTHTPVARARQYTCAPLLNSHTRRSCLHANTRARLCSTHTHAARACTPTRARLCPLLPLVGRPVCSHTPRLPYPQNTCHSAKGGWRTHSRRKPYVTSALSQLQLESRATLNCFSEHCLTLFVQRVVSDV